MVWKNDNTEPFGNSQPDENPSGLGAFTYNLRFPGQYFDAETGTHYNYFRDYDPSIGRYITADPLGVTLGRRSSRAVKRAMPGVGLGLNLLYGYVGASPLNWIDPRGLDIAAPPVKPPKAGTGKGDRNDKCPLVAWIKLDTTWNGPAFGYPPNVLISCVYDCAPPYGCVPNPDDYLVFKLMRVAELMPGLVDGFKICPEYIEE